MKNGIYTVDSIEKSRAKLLWRENESIEEVIDVAELGTDVQKGDLIRVTSFSGGLQKELLKEETQSVKEQARKMKEELLKRKK